MTAVYFVRHAQPNTDNHDDLTRELSPKGLRDRALVTAFLADKPIDAVISSPYKRAYDTIAPLAQAIGRDIQVAADFRERKVDGGWIEDFHAFAQRQWQDFDYKLSDGESLNEVQFRAVNALEELLKTHCGKTIVIGSHGTAISAIINHYRPDFGYADFERIRSLMPWIVKMTFENGECSGIQEYDLFKQESGK